MQKSPFIPGHLYSRRKDIHAIYGGNWQSGICPSSKYPYIFIFSGKTGKQHGYLDQWDNDNIYTYTGEGQEGDMAFTRGNLALKDHLNSGKRVFLFEIVKKGYVRFSSEVEYFDFGYFETSDTKGNNRIGIKFFFKRVGAYVPVRPEELVQTSLVAEGIPAYGIIPPNVTEREGLVTSRVGQGVYRKRIIHRWEYKCAVTGFNKLDILIASHILPWAESTDNERMDVNNGLLLSPTYDALFDRHLISFENNGKILLSDKIESSAYEKIGVTGTERIEKLHLENYAYMERHREAYHLL